MLVLFPVFQTLAVCAPETLKVIIASGHHLPYLANPFPLYSRPKPPHFSPLSGNYYVRRLKENKQQQKYFLTLLARLFSLSSRHKLFLIVLLLEWLQNPRDPNSYRTTFNGLYVLNSFFWHFTYPSKPFPERW